MKPAKRESFASRLRQLRTVAKLSVRELVEASGLPRQTIHRLERGEREPTWQTVCKLATALGVSTEAFH
jgi:transcriptional regulator with XRE-family HTH domain